MIRVDDTSRMYVLINGSWQTYIDEQTASRGSLSVAPGEPPDPFLRSYRERPDLRQALGSAISGVRVYPVTIQSFEHGVVLGTDKQQLIVLYNDGTWEQVPDR